MEAALHPEAALFDGERALPALPPCEHFAGSEKLILKSFSLQQEIGAVFDITCDCEDGAPRGAEREHAQRVGELIAGRANVFGRAGARVHEVTSPFWRDDVSTIVEHAGDRVAYLTLPKVQRAADVREVLDHLSDVVARVGLQRRIPIHALIETHAGLRDVHAIAALDGVETLDFGLLDFISAHRGAIPTTAMRSPGQFDHPLVRRAKCEIAAAALGAGCIPSHNITLDLAHPEQAGADAARARNEFGFLRMYSIHPSQIQPIVAAMRPPAEAVTDAADLLLAARAAAWGPIRFRDEMHDRASYRHYWTLLQSARVGGMQLPADAERAFFATNG